jgi:putative exosortase-associated protein (TIGR04073 family)
LSAIVHNKGQNVRQIPFTTLAVPVTSGKTNMRKLISSAMATLAIGLFATGCAGPEQKLGRGIGNVTEIARMGEVRRSMEQTGIWEGTDKAYTVGMIRGMNRTLARTAVGAFEILTFPFPPWDPIFLPTDPVYPDSYTPNLIADGTFGPDAALGFSGGDIAPMVPGSRFRVFDY